MPVAEVLAVETVPGGAKALLQVPARSDGDSGPRPLAVMLHGAGGSPEQGLALLAPFAAEAGVLVLAPASAGDTWDSVQGTPRGNAKGTDAQGIEQAVAWVRERHDIDARRLVIGGFSDGASCALGLGLARADLFCCIVALSPGFIPRTTPKARPPVFISHGTHDTVLPITRCSRLIVTRLREFGCDVSYREFEGGHVIPPDIARQAVAWLLRGPADGQRAPAGQSGHADSRARHPGEHPGEHAG